MKRMQAVATVMAALDQQLGSREPLLVVCNGMIGREVFTVGDKPRHFYMIGSMGLALSIGLGLALARPDREVVVFDGDGNLLMGLGVLATVGALQPRNLWHVIFDNEAHGSTGGQRTVSGLVPLDAVCAAVGFAGAERVVAPEHDLAEKAALFFQRAGPQALLVKVEKGNEHSIARVTPGPAALALRFRQEACQA